MIDIHFHVIPGVDDGPNKMEESLEMLRLAAKQGASVVVATFHSWGLRWVAREEVQRQFEELREKAQEEGIPVEICLGCEVNFCYDQLERGLEKLKKGTYPTINGTKYVLTEFEPETEKGFAFKCVDGILKAGYIPVIAHAERYDFIDAESAEQLCELGALIQINVYSVFQECNETTRNKANELVAKQLVVFTGSDSHRLWHRPPKMASGIEYLYENYPADYVDAILFGNAQRYLIKKETT